MATFSRYTVAVVIVPETDEQVAVFSKAAPTTRALQRTDMDAVLARGGFELRHLDSRVSTAEFPLLVLLYRSPNREGVGRSGSMLYRIRCRRVAT